MSDVTLTKTRIRAGVWEGVLTAPSPPVIEVQHLGQALAGVKVTPLAGAQGSYSLAVPIPAAALFDGVQSFVIQNKADGATLASFAIVTGTPLEEDLRAEIDLLRAELDLLKRAFRRHCVETA